MILLGEAGDAAPTGDGHMTNTSCLHPSLAHNLLCLSATLLLTAAKMLTFLTMPLCVVAVLLASAALACCVCKFGVHAIACSISATTSIIDYHYVVVAIPVRCCVQRVTSDQYSLGCHCANINQQDRLAAYPLADMVRSLSVDLCAPGDFALA